MDAFDVLSLAPRFTIDVASLEARYRDLQRHLHPDRFVNASASERRESLSRAMGVNEAYRTLRDELKRAELLLARAGRSTSEHETAEPETLMEVMELREQLADARAARNLGTAQKLSADVAARELKLRQVLADAFDGDPAVRTAVTVEAAARALARLRYYKRFQDEVLALEDDASE
jgi:molecular chaperone HscB